MGFVAAALPAARLVHPDRPALGFVGDGSFQMVLHVLAMAAEHELGVTWCVLDDGALGRSATSSISLLGALLGTEFDFQPDFAAIARACACHGERVDDPTDVSAGLGRALEANERGVPAVLDFGVSRERLLGPLEHYAFYPPALEAHA